MKLKFIVIFILACAVIIANYHVRNIDVKTPLINKTFPKQLEEWVGTDVKVAKSVFKLLNKNNLLFRNYKNAKTDQQINLAIVLTEERSQIHDPEVCYRFQGIEMNKEENIVIDKDYVVKHVFGLKKKQPYDIIYWYTDLNNTFTGRVKFMKHITLSKFFDKPMNGFALIVIISPKSKDSKVYEFAEKVNKFMLSLGSSNNSNRQRVKP